MKRRVSNPLALVILGLLCERPMHPYEMAAQMRYRGLHQNFKLNYGSLYSVVESLQKHGLIQARETTREGRRPERTVYEITPAGQDEFEDWLAELLSTPARDFTSLEAGLSLMAGLPPEEVARLLAERASKLQMEIGGLDAMLAYGVILVLVGLCVGRVGGPAPLLDEREKPRDQSPGSAAAAHDPGTGNERGADRVQ